MVVKTIHGDVSYEMEPNTHSQPQKESKDGKVYPDRIHVSYNLPSLSGFEIARVFERFGKIKNVYFGNGKISGLKSMKKTFVFVSFEKESSAKAAIKLKVLKAQGNTFEIHVGFKQKPKKNRKKQDYEASKPCTTLVPCLFCIELRKKLAGQFKVSQDLVEFEGGFKAATSS